MKITEIEYGQVRNDGNFGNDRLTLRAELDEGEDPEVAIAALAGVVTTQLEHITRGAQAAKRAYYDDAGLG